MASSSEVKVHTQVDGFDVIDLGPTKVNGPSAKARKKGKKIVVKDASGKTHHIEIPRPIVAEIKRTFQAAFWDNETLDSPAGTFSAFSFINQIGQGVGANERLGDQVVVLGLRIRFIAIQSIAVAHFPARLDLVVDKQPAAGASAWTDLYQGIGGANANAYIVAIPDFDRRTRYEYLDSRILVSSWTAAYADGGGAHIAVKPMVGEFDVRINRKIKFDSNVIMSGVEYWLYGWGVQNSDTTQVTASYELFFQDA